MVDVDLDAAWKLDVGFKETGENKIYKDFKWLKIEISNIYTFF